MQSVKHKYNGSADVLSEASVSISFLLLLLLLPDNYFTAFPPCQYGQTGELVKGKNTWI